MHEVKGKNFFPWFERIVHLNFEFFAHNAAERENSIS